MLVGVWSLKLKEIVAEEYFPCGIVFLMGVARAGCWAWLALCGIVSDQTKR